jgi:hypothetical protein
LKSKDPRTDPWGTPERISKDEKRIPETRTRDFRLNK